MQTDMEWIVRAEKKVLERWGEWTADSLTGAGRTFRGHSETNINPCGHGALRPVLAMAASHGAEDVLEWIAVHIEDFLACYWSCKISSGKPPGEGCRLVDGKLVNVDYDDLRHMHCHGVIHAAMRLHAYSRISDELLADVRHMAQDWGQWILSNFIRDGRLIREREYHRAGIPGQDLVAIHMITGEAHWLHYAMAHFMRYWDAPMSRTVPDTSFSTYDTGWPWEPRGNYMGNVTMWPWYHGEMAEFFWDLFPHADPVVQGRIAQVITETSDWYVKRDQCPPLLAEGRRNTMLHGGYLSEGQEYPWYRGQYMDPSAWDALSQTTKMKPLCIQEWHEWPGQYLAKECCDPAGNIWPMDHHQDRWPKLYRGSGWGVPSLLAARAAITGNATDKLWKAWATHDYCGFANHVAVQDVIDKGDVNEDWTGGAQGVGRGGQWLLRAGWRHRTGKQRS